MEVHADDVSRDLVNLIGHRHADSFSCGDIAAYRMEEKCAGTTGSVENTLCKRCIGSFRDDDMGESVRRVILTETLPRLRSDDAFVKHLKNILLNRTPIEPRQAAA
jgi:hypothetical protein